MSSQIKYISDLHLGHKNILKYQPDTRPFKDMMEMIYFIIAEWNSVVSKKDTVWVCGDVSFGKQHLPIYKDLNGYKRLVLGNHDTQPISEYMKYFDRIYGCGEKSKCIISHIPVHPDQLDDGGPEGGRYNYNIHGHDHKGEDRGKKYLNCNVDVIGFKPLTFEELRRFHNV